MSGGVQAQVACPERAITTAGLRTRMCYWVTSGAKSDKGQLKELDMTHLERKYLKIAKIVTEQGQQVLCVAETGELGLRGSQQAFTLRKARAACR